MGDDLTAATVTSLVVVVVDEDEGVVTVRHAPTVVDHPLEGPEVPNALLDLLAVAELGDTTQTVVLIYLLCYGECCDTEKMHSKGIQQGYSQVQQKRVVGTLFSSFSF